jgi:beta-glucosidase
MKTQGQVNMPWIDDVHTMVQAWYPGQEDGNVVAEALFGVTNFSGKLPITIGQSDREAAYETQEQYPGNLEDTGVPGGIGRDPLCQDPEEAPPCDESGPAPQRVVRYSEDLQMGYRWYEATGTEPIFPFGHGLSYTTFTYSDLSVTEVRASDGHTTLRVDYTITNTGERAGMETSQVYLTLTDEAGEPAKRLVGFDKIELDAGESKQLSVLIESNASNHPFSYFQPDDADDLSNWADGAWVTPDGSYTVHVGGSSADTPLEETVELDFDDTEPVSGDATDSTVIEGD